MSGDLHAGDWPRILAQRGLARTRLFRVEELALQFSNGAERTYERLNPDFDRAVVIVPITADNELLLVREYGAGIGRYYWSLPKGAMDPGETPEQAANRELMEEIGFGARRITRLRQIALSPSYMGNRLHLLLAQDLYPEQRLGDEPEPLAVKRWPLAELDALLDDPDFCESYAFSALLLVQRHLRLLEVA